LRRAGYPELVWADILDIAAVVIGERVEESIALWLWEETVCGRVDVRVTRGAIGVDYDIAQSREQTCPSNAARRTGARRMARSLRASTAQDSYLLSHTESYASS
jgi:hypothetical protein